MIVGLPRQGGDEQRGGVVNGQNAVAVHNIRVMDTAVVRKK